MSQEFTAGIAVNDDVEVTKGRKEEEGKEEEEFEMVAVEEVTKETAIAPNPPAGPLTLSQKWSNLVNSLRAPIIKMLLWVTDKSAANPKSCIALVIAVSILLVAIGIFTNFELVVDGDLLWTPFGSRSLSHGDWIEDTSGFPGFDRNYLLLVHAAGANVATLEGVRLVFTALDTIRDTPGYDDVCARRPRPPGALPETMLPADTMCDVYSVARFWNNSVEVLESSVSTDEDVRIAISRSTFPDGTRVDAEQIMGQVVRDPNTNMIQSAQSFISYVLLPEIGADVEAFEEDSINRLEVVRTDLASSGSELRLGQFAERSFDDEFNRAIVRDIPLVPMVFVIMSFFTGIIFFKRDWVLSRTMMGFGAVVSVLLSIMTGYGLMFIIGVPFTSMTQILPFIMFGIGLDDAFIISGEYARTDKSKTPEERLHDTIETVGLSILLTTITSVAAFALGCTSSVPAVYWLCLYAFPTIFLDFVYQISFFVAVLVLDERRVQENRRDWIVCSTVRRPEETASPEEGESYFDRFMGWFADHVLARVWVKVLTILCFAGLLGGCVYSATQLTQEFEFTDIVPSDSYVRDFWQNYRVFNTPSGVTPDVYFRFVDQSNPDIQDQMDRYVRELVALPQAGVDPTFFWLWDFRDYIATNDTVVVDGVETPVAILPFVDQLTAFLDVSPNRAFYLDDIVRDPNTGEIITSRVELRFGDVNQENIVEQIDALKAQREVSERQPVNEGRDEWAFFTFSNLYYIWEFYSVSEGELTLTTIFGIAAVTTISLLFIPHWSAVLFVLPLIGILYVDLLGVLQFAGLHINAVSYVSLVMSIGLLVDFLMHVLLRYYESPKDTRQAKVKDTLQTMGSSILVGGISTFLGVLPLAFSTSEIFTTIFVTFIGLVTLGAGHGLILLPVLLSFLGTKECVIVHDKNPETTTPDDAEQVEAKA